MERAAIAQHIAVGDVGGSPHLLCQIIQRVTPVARFLLTIKETPLLQQERFKGIAVLEVFPTQNYTLILIAMPVKVKNTGFYNARDKEALQ